MVAPVAQVVRTQLFVYPINELILKEKNQLMRHILTSAVFFLVLFLHANCFSQFRMNFDGG
jgi:hypothetical protein